MWPVLGGLITAFASDGIASHGGRQLVGALHDRLRGAQLLGEAGPAHGVRAQRAGEFTPPNPQGSTAGLSDAIAQPDGTFRPQYGGLDPTAYLPSTYAYVIAQTDGFDPAKGAVLGTFLNYAVTKGQERAVPLGYSRLPPVLVDLALDRIQQIPGAPPRPTGEDGEPPVEPPAVVPEAPLAVLLPVTASLLGLVALRRRSRNADADAG